MPESLGEGHAATLTSPQPSAYWGEEKIWSQRVNNHNPIVRQGGPAVAGPRRSAARPIRPTVRRAPN